MAVDQRPVVIGGRYRLDELVRSGDHVRVHRAFDTLLQREVIATVSTYPAGEVDEVVRHQDAARLAASLSHHNLVPVLDYQRVECADGSASLVVVLELAQGQSLRRRLREGVPLTTKQAAYLGFDLAEAFEHLHEHGVVLHGLTPRAVFLAEQDDGFLRAQLADLSAGVRLADPSSRPGR